MFKNASIYLLSQQVSPKKDSAFSLWLEAFMQWVGSGADVAVTLFYSCTSHLSATNLQQAAVFTHSWERFKQDFIPRMIFNFKYSMKHSFCCMKIGHFRNISLGLSVSQNLRVSRVMLQVSKYMSKMEKCLCDLKMQLKSQILKHRQFLTHAKEVTSAPSITL